MAITYPTGYYNRSSASAAKGYERHIFLANHIAQSAEVNEIQDEANSRIKGIGDVLFRDGAPINYAQIVVNSSTGVVAGDSGIIYANGKLYAVPSSTLSISTAGTVSLGIYITSSVVGPETDNDLYDPALEAASYQEPGASRLKAVPAWGYDGDGNTGDFYSIYTVIDGIVQPYTPPPDIAPINQAIARYDRQSTGSNYVASGMGVTILDDDGGNQQFLIAEGEARLQGHEIILQNSYRVFFAEGADTDTVVAETRTVTGDNPFTVTVNRPPISSVSLITAQKSIADEGVTKAVGDYDSVVKRDSLVSMTSVYQSTTEYTTPTHYSLTDSGDPPTNQIAWVSSVRPANGTTFYVSYAYTAQYPTDTALLANSSSTHIGVADADEGSTVSVNYLYKVPRYDRLCINKTGTAVMVTGVPHADRPTVPSVPGDLLPLAIIHQTWIAATRTVTRDGVRMVPMAEIETMTERLDDLTALVADCRNALYGSLYDPVVKRGLFTDSLHTDDLRDWGLDNTALIDFGNQTLMCDVDWTVFQHSESDAITLVEGTPRIALEQTLKTGTTLINPYYSFSDEANWIPAQAKLEPSIDTWVDVETVNGGRSSWFFLIFLFPFLLIAQAIWASGRGTAKPKLYREISREEAAYLREITVKFEITGFQSEEHLSGMTFDGLTVVPRATEAP